MFTPFISTRKVNVDIDRNQLRHNIENFLVTSVKIRAVLSTMEIFFLCDDVDDATIFADAISEIDASIICTVLSSKIQVTSALAERKDLPTMFLDFNNLPERFTRNLIQYLRSNQRWSNVKIIIYTNSFEITRQKQEELTSLGVNDFLIKTSDVTIMRNSILHLLNRLS